MLYNWLATQGYICQLATLEPRYKQWGFTRRRLSTGLAVIAYINVQFHTTFDNDEAIAEQLNTLGYPITGATVESTSLANGWRHWQVTSAQAWEETFARVGKRPWRDFRALLAEKVSDGGCLLIARRVFCTRKSGLRLESILVDPLQFGFHRPL
jgi:hypothetical protein